MTIALGILVGRGIVLAADTEQTYGEHKLTALKTRAVFPNHEHSTMAIAGAGDAWYIEAITERLEKVHAEYGAATLPELEVAIRAELEEFYKRHIIPFNDPDLDIQLLIGLQHAPANHPEALQNVLWATSRSTMRSVYGYEAVGAGDVVAKGVVANAMYFDSFEEAVLVACCAVYEAKQKVVGCGKATTVECLFGNQAHHMYQDVIGGVEDWYDKYLAASSVGFSYSIGHFRDPEIQVEKITAAFRNSRDQSRALMEKIAKDIRQ